MRSLWSRVKGKIKPVVKPSHVRSSTSLSQLSAQEVKDSDVDYKNRRSVDSIPSSSSHLSQSDHGMNLRKRLPESPLDEETLISPQNVSAASSQDEVQKTFSPDISTPQKSPPIPDEPAPMPLQDAPTASASDESQLVFQVSATSQEPPQSTDDESSLAPIIKLKKKKFKIEKSVSFVDANGGDVEEVVTQSAKRLASSRLAAHNVFTIEESVQIFFVDSNGMVSAEEGTTSLHIVRLYPKAGTMDIGNTKPTAFLQVGIWLYPFFPGYSPVLITAFGTYLFPDLRNHKEGSSVALVLSQDVSLDEREQFEILLDYYAYVEDSVNRLEVNQSRDSSWWDEYEEEEKEMVASHSNLSVAARNIRYVAQTIVWFIFLIAEFGVWIIRYIASMIRSKGRRASQHHTVDPAILQGVLYAKSATGQGVILTSIVVDNLLEGTMNLSRILAPRPSVFVPNPSQKSKLGNVWSITAEVGVTTYRGVAEVYKSLAQASTMLVEAFSEETIKTMEYKYGEEYGNLTKEALGAALNMREALINTSKITSLAFVPNTINTRIKERIGSTSGFDYMSASDSEESLVKRRTKSEKERHSKSKHDTNSLEEEDSHSVLKLRRREDNKKWAWATQDLNDQAALEANILGSSVGTSSSFETDNFENLGQTHYPLHTQTESHSALAEKLKKTDSIDHFPLLKTKSSDTIISEKGVKSALSPKSSNTSFRRLTKTDSTISTSSKISSRKSSYNTACPNSIRRQSVFLSPRRQSMHVHAAMANIVQDKFSNLESLSMLTECQKEAHNNLFKAAAVSITRAKIRRMHREAADEKFLVVVRLARKYP